jgi:hypothetical protein
MRKNLAGWVLPLALFGCGTPLVWQGPPGADLDETRRECEHRADAWRQHSDLMYQSQAIVEPAQNMNGPPRATEERYRAVEQIFADCMRDQGFALVARGQ